MEKLLPIDSDLVLKSFSPADLVDNLLELN
jgi:hypothetical protein